MTGNKYDGDPTRNAAERNAAESEAAIAPTRKANSETIEKQNAQLKAYFLLILSEGYDPNKISPDFIVVAEIMMSQGPNREKLFAFLKEFAYVNNLDWEKIRTAIELQLEISEKMHDIESKFLSATAAATSEAISEFEAMLSAGKLPGIDALHHAMLRITLTAQTAQFKALEIILAKSGLMTDLSPTALDGENAPESFASIIDRLLLELHSGTDNTSPFETMLSLIDHTEGEAMTHEELIAVIQASSEMSGIVWSSIEMRVKKLLQTAKNVRRATKKQLDRETELMKNREERRRSNAQNRLT